MVQEDIEISNENYTIKASVIKPKKINSKTGIILSHGSIINRQSLLREKNSLGSYLCEKLDAYIIAPDFLGETIHKKGLQFSNFSKIINDTSDYFVDKYELETLVGYGHSMGCYVLADAVQSNPHIDAIANYGGPIVELKKGKGFINYLAKYISTYKYNLNMRNILSHIFDKETCRYLENVMMVEDEYKGNNYVFEFDSSFYLDIMNIIPNYIDLIKKWGKQTLILFGTQDGVTKSSLNHYNHNQVENNVLFKHIDYGSHVTPCMKSRFQLSKLDPIVQFYSQVFSNEVHSLRALRTQ